MSVPAPSPVGLVYTFLIFLICEMNWVDSDMSELLNVSDGAGLTITLINTDKKWQNFKNTCEQLESL